MNKFTFSPEKYWNIPDERLSFLKAYLDSLGIEQLDILLPEEIIEKCIKGLQAFKLSNEEKSRFKSLIRAQNEKTMDFCIREICKELSNLFLDEVLFLSLGCGNVGSFERKLDQAVRQKLPHLKLNWLGLDVGDFRDDSSFFKENAFKVIEEHPDVEYISFVEDKRVPVILVGRFSFHHIGIEYSDFLKRCRGIKMVALIEEPTTNELWNVADYRFMRIAYDVLANTLFVLHWAETFIKDPTLFKINYIKADNVPKNSRIIEFKGTLPETALVIS